MCKIAVIPKIKKGLEYRAWKLAEALTPLMSKNDDDGFGYMALGQEGVFGQRWLNPEDAWKTPTVMTPAADACLQTYGDAVAPLAVGNSFGKSTERVFGLCLHARMATCGVGIGNTHPFMSDDGKTAIIHNGVISNSSIFELKQSTCDSEAILISYRAHAVAESLANIHNAIAPLIGWYAVAAYAQDSRGVWFLDVFKDARSNLYGVWIEELEGLVFCTSLEMLQVACRKLKYKITRSFQVKDCVAIRHDARTGRVLETLDIDPTIMPVVTSPYVYDDTPITADDVAHIEAIPSDYDDDCPLDVCDAFSDPFAVRVRRGA